MAYVAFSSSLFFRRKIKCYGTKAELLTAYATGAIGPDWSVRNVRDMDAPISVAEVANGYGQMMFDGPAIRFLVSNSKIKHGFRPAYDAQDVALCEEHYRSIVLTGRVPSEFKFVLEPTDRVPAKKDRMGKLEGGEANIYLAKAHYDTVESQLAVRRFDELTVTLFLNRKDGAKYDDPPRADGSIHQTSFEFHTSM